VVIKLLATVDVSTSVIHATPSGRAFKTGIGCHVRLETKNWFDASLFTFSIEVDNAVHVSVVSDSDCRLTVSNGSGN
jgi:hypothetical protein